MTPSTELSAAVASLRGALGAAAVKAPFPLGPRTTYRVGGDAAIGAVVDRPDDLVAVAAVVAEHDLDVIVVGKGSNLLVADEGFDGVALVLGAGFAAVEIAGTEVVAGSGASLPVVARRSAAAGLTGFEWAVGVPGSIGGAIRMNAGGHGSDMSEALVGADVVDLRTGERRCWSVAELELGYRRSALTDDDLVVSGRLGLAAGEAERSVAEIDEIVRWRREHQPGGTNAGSVFTNPDGDSAGRLIEAAGCKGLRLGSASVSTKHANFIQSDTGGSAADIRRLMVEVQRRVRSQLGVTLVAETVLVGFGGDPT